MSMAGPATWITLPSTNADVIAISLIPDKPEACPTLIQPGRAADNFDNFSGNTGLPYAIHLQRQRVDHFRRIRAGSFHGRHSRSMFSRGGFQRSEEHTSELQ